MGRGICPDCGSGKVSRETGPNGSTGDWKCDDCGYANMPEAFKQPEKEDELSDESN